MAAAPGLAIGRERPGVRNGRIAFADAPGRTVGPTALPHAQIYTIELDGKDRLQLTTGSAGNFFPAWSPEGCRLVFFRAVDSGHSQIWVIEVDGRDERQLTTSGNDRGFGQVWVMNAYGSKPHALTAPW